jgi:hypothetical protein
MGSETNETVDHSISSQGEEDESSYLARRKSLETSQDTYCEEAILSIRDLEFEEMADDAETYGDQDVRKTGSSSRHGRRRSRSSSRGRASTHHRCSVRRRHNSCVDFTFLPQNKFCTNTSKLLKLNLIFERAADRHSGGIREDRLLKMIPVSSPTKIKYGHLKSRDRCLTKDRKNVVDEQALRIISRGPFLAMFAYENLNLVNSMAVNEKQAREKVKARKNRQDGVKKKKAPKGSNSNHGTEVGKIDEPKKAEKIKELVANQSGVDGDSMHEEALLTENNCISAGRGRANTAPTTTGFEQLQVDALSSAAPVSGSTADKRTFTKQEMDDTSPKSVMSLESTGSLGDENGSVVSLSDPCAAGTRTKVDESRGRGHAQATAGTKTTKALSKRRSSQRGVKRHKQRVADSDSNAFLQDENSSVGSSRSTKTRNSSRSSSPYKKDRTGRRRTRSSSSRRTRDSSVDSARSGSSVSHSSRDSSFSFDGSSRSLSGAPNSTQNSFVPFVVSTCNSRLSTCNVSSVDGTGSSSFASARMKTYQDAQTSTDPVETNGHALLQRDTLHFGSQGQPGTSEREQEFFRTGHVNGISHGPGLTATETLSSEARQADTVQGAHPDEEIWNLSSYSMTSDEDGEQGGLQERSLPNRVPTSENLAVGNREGSHFIKEGLNQERSPGKHGDDCANCPLAGVAKVLRQMLPSFYKQDCVNEQRAESTRERRYQYHVNQNSSSIFRGADRSVNDQAWAPYPTNMEGLSVVPVQHPKMYYPQGARGFAGPPGRLEHALQYQRGMNPPNAVVPVPYPATVSQQQFVRPRFASTPLNEKSRAVPQSHDEEMTPFAGMKSPFENPNTKKNSLAVPQSHDEEMTPFAGMKSPFENPKTNDYSNSANAVPFDERMERESIARSQDEEFRVEKD